MVPEIGQFALILALVMALVQGTLPVIGAWKNIPEWMSLAKPAAWSQLLFLLIAFGCLAYSFVVYDFSVLYVASNSNTQLPLMYRISAVWGAHEGSLLLWALTLSLWTGAVTIFSKNIPQVMIARVVGVMGMVSIGFLLFLILTSNPFERLFPVPTQGRDLNPLLQDPGLAIHPPMLYMGYVGFSVAFAFAIAAMLGGRLDSAWARWSRPWTTVAWVFLTLGITLGSWWAYYELGWGGWWFWDPVENASFMPWLVGTALIHSLAVTEKRGSFKAWTVLLAIFAFSLSLLGTFLVRSGVLTSVHAFATDPARGVFILVFLFMVVGGSLLLYAIRAPQVKNASQFEMVSRDTALLFNNVLLVATAFTILLGTLYPLAMDALALGKISVGPPYFNTVFVPLTIPLALLVGVGALMRWKRDDIPRLAKKLWFIAVISVVAGFVFILIYKTAVQPMAVIGVALALWVMITAIIGIHDRIKGKNGVITGLTTVPRGFYGMSLAHFGIGVFIIGICLTSVFSSEKDVRLSPGESYSLGGYNFIFNGITQKNGENYLAYEGDVKVMQGNQQIANLRPQKRIYISQSNPMTEAAIDAGLTRDLFVALGEQLDSNNAWSVRLYHKPFIRWIWFGAVFMAIGGLLAASDRRYRKINNKTAIKGTGS